MDRTILIRNGVLTLLLVVVAIVAMRTHDLDSDKRTMIVTGCLTFIAGLWTRSGRGPGDPPVPSPPSTGSAPGSAVLPVICALALAGCRVGGSVGLAVSEREAPGAQAGTLLADLIEMKPQNPSGVSCASGRACVYASSTDNLLYTIDAAGTLLNLHAAQGVRISANCAGLASPANGDLCFDSGAGAFYAYASGWGVFPVADGLLVHRAGAENITGSKTWNADQSTTDASYKWGDATHRFTQVGAVKVASGSSSATIEAGVADGASAIACKVNNTVALANAAARLASWQNNSVEKAALRYDGALLAPSAGTSFAAQHAFPTGTGDLCSLDATQTLAAKTLTTPVINGASSASGNFDLSGSNGTTKTTTGAVTIGPGAVGVSGDMTLTTGKLLKLGSNTVGGAVTDKLNAAMLAIAAQAVGDILFGDSTTTFARLAAGTSGYVLTANGAGIAPSWQAASGGGGLTSIADYYGLNIAETSGDDSVGGFFAVIVAGKSATGVRFYKDDAMAESIAVTIWDNGVAVATQTQSVSGTGAKTISFGMPYALTAGHPYVVSIRETTGSIYYYAGLANVVALAPGTPVGQVVYGAMNLAASGNFVPDITASTLFFAVEVVLN